MQPIELDSAAFRDVIGRFASGVTVITTAVHDELFGATASAVTSLSDSPPMLLICLNSASSTAGAVTESGRFAVNVLAEDHADLALNFASRSPDKFANSAFTRHDELPLLSGAIAHLVCDVFEQTRGGTHIVFLARVVHAVAFPGHPLAYFRGAFGRMQTRPQADVVRRLREWVLQNGSEDETPIGIRSIAADLGVEDGLVHHGLVSLAGEGLIIRRAGDFFIVPLPEEVIYDAYMAKSIIELGVAAKIAADLDPAAMREMRRLAASAREIAARRDYDELDSWIDAIHAVNEFIVGQAGSRALVEAYRTLGLPGIDRRSLDPRVYSQIADLRGVDALLDAYETGEPRRVMDVLARRKGPRELRETLAGERTRS